jgi:hypothetical protein
MPYSRLGYQSGGSGGAQGPQGAPGAANLTNATVNAALIGLGTIFGTGSTTWSQSPDGSTWIGPKYQSTDLISSSEFVLINDVNGNIIANTGGITNTILEYLSGLNQNVQSALTTLQDDILGLPSFSLTSNQFLYASAGNAVSSTSDLELVGGNIVASVPVSIQTVNSGAFVVQGSSSNDFFFVNTEASTPAVSILADGGVSGSNGTVGVVAATLAGNTGTINIVGNDDNGNATLNIFASNPTILTGSSNIAGTGVGTINFGSANDTLKFVGGGGIDIGTTSSTTSISIGNSSSTTAFTGTVTGIGGTISGLTAGIVPVGATGSSIENSNALAGNITLDCSGAHTLNLGNTNASAVNIGNSGTLTLNTSGPINIGNTYTRMVQLGGNSRAYTYGSFAALGDGVHWGYNAYYDSAGTGHIDDTGGATSRIAVEFGQIGFYTGNINALPTNQCLILGNGGGNYSCNTHSNTLDAGDGTGNMTLAANATINGTTTLTINSTGTLTTAASASSSVEGICAIYGNSSTGVGTLSITAGNNSSGATNNQITIQGGSSNAGNVFLGNSSMTDTMTVRGTLLVGQSGTSIAFNPNVHGVADNLTWHEFTVSLTSSENQTVTIAYPGSYGISNLRQLYANAYIAGADIFVPSSYPYPGGSSSSDLGNAAYLFGVDGGTSNIAVSTGNTWTTAATVYVWAAFTGGIFSEDETSREFLAETKNKSTGQILPPTKVVSRQVPNKEKIYREELDALKTMVEKMDKEIKILRGSPVIDSDDYEEAKEHVATTPTNPAAEMEIDSDFDD